MLDLYCGTGALAIEALSRGAARAVLVDRDTRPALGNVERLGLGERVELVRADVGRWLAGVPRGLRPALASTSSSSMPPIDSPTSWRSELDTHLPRLLAAERARRSSRAAPAGRSGIDSLERLRQRRYGAADVSIYAGADEVSERNGTVVCPGSYDPVTNGHIDIITRTSNVFDQVVVGVVNNPVRKEKTLFTAEERRDFIDEATADLRQRRGADLLHPAGRVRPRQRRQGDRQGHAGDLRLRVRVRDGAAEPQARSRASRAST